MRVLLLSNLYPPYANGGYEQLCEEIADELTGRGHSLCVLTSRLRRTLQRPPMDTGGVEVRRELSLEVESGVLHTAIRLLRDRRRLEQENLRSLREAVGTFQPDVALIWGMWNIPRSVPALAEQILPGRVVYYLCDYWPSLPSAYLQQWQEPARGTLTRGPKRLLSLPFVWWLSRLARPQLRLDRAACVSGAVRDRLVVDGVLPAHARIIHNGIDVSDFAPMGLARWRSARCRPLRLLYAGRLCREKGVATAIRAIGLLSEETLPPTLDLIGRGEPAYERELRRLVESLGLEGRVTFRGSVPRAEMPTVLGDYYALLFPSEWPEPLARMVMEAMAVGLVVVGTTTGGTGELLLEGETGLTFPTGDADLLASQIQRLADDPALGQQLAGAARQRVEEEFTIARTVDQLESILEETAREGSTPRSAIRL